MGTEVHSAQSLERHGIVNLTRAHWNLSTGPLYEEAVRRGEGLIAADGPLVCRTGQHTGRSPNDKFIVREPDTEGSIWWGDVNVAIDEIGFQPIASWDSLRMASGKRERSLAIGVGTPGLDRENALYHVRKLVKEDADIVFANEKEITALYQVNSFAEAVTAVRHDCDIAVQVLDSLRN